MAAISKENGGWRIQFTASDGKRQTIRLGKVSKKAAESIKYRVEQLLESLNLNRPMETDLSQWVAGLPQPLAEKLVAVGLISKPEKKVTTVLGPFLRTHLDGLAGLKPPTKIVRNHVIRDLNEFFGELCDVRTILPGHADDFKQYLIGLGLASTTIQKRLQVARWFFHAMRRRKLIDENPFDGVNVPATGIKDRQQFVTRDEIARVLEKCPNHHWRIIVALARYGGLRCPSEVLSLRWQDIDWDANRIVVTSPKTEHHEGKACRTIPLFAELRPYLEEAFELAPEGAEFVVDEKYRKAAMGPEGWINANLRTTFLKIVKRAGLKSWPRPFHNLRASRETELVEKYPVQVVTAWLGNTPRIAMKHYLMTTDEHFEKAVKGDAESTQKATQNPTQQMPEVRRITSHPLLDENPQLQVLQGVTRTCCSMQPPVSGEDRIQKAAYCKPLPIWYLRW